MENTESFRKSKKLKIRKISSIMKVPNIWKTSEIQRIQKRSENWKIQKIQKFKKIDKFWKVEEFRRFAKFETPLKFYKLRKAEKEYKTSKILKIQQIWKLSILQKAKKSQNEGSIELRCIQILNAFFKSSGLKLGENNFTMEMMNLQGDLITSELWNMNRFG